MRVSGTYHFLRTNLPVFLNIPKSERADYEDQSRIERIRRRRGYLAVDVIACARPRYVFCKNEKLNLSF